MENTNDVILLHEIYQSARTAMDAIGAILPKTKDQSLVSGLSTQRTQYHDLAKEAAQRLLDCIRFRRSSTCSAKAPSGRPSSFPRC